MKKNLIITLLLMCTGLSLFAQNDPVWPKDTYVSIGAYGSTMVAINTLVTEGLKNQPVFFGLSDFGISLNFMQMEKYGMTLNLGLSNSGYSKDITPGISLMALPVKGLGMILNCGWSNNGYASVPAVAPYDKYTNYYYIKYLSINPMLYLGGFIIGVNFASPTTNKLRYDDGKNPPDKYISITPKSVTELRAGGLINLFENEIAKVNMNILAGYQLGKYDTQSMALVKTNFTLTKIPTQLVFLNIGFSVFFKIGGY